MIELLMMQPGCIAQVVPARAGLFFGIDCRDSGFLGEIHHDVSTYTIFVEAIKIEVYRKSYKFFGILITLVAIACDTLKIFSPKSKLRKSLFCVEEVHPGSDRTSCSVAQNQVPKHKSDL